MCGRNTRNTFQSRSKKYTDLIGRREYFILPKSAATGSRDALDRQLEKALMHGYSMIVVEPRGLGDEIIL